MPGSSARQRVGFRKPDRRSHLASAVRTRMPHSLPRREIPSGIP
jgi:hypothetical protein